MPLYYGCEDDENIYLAMPLYKNGSLKQLMHKKRLTIREIVSLSTDILSAIQNIHSKKLIHFDIKPDNILLSDTNDALLSDFGLAKQMSFMNVAEQDRIYGKMLPPEVLTSGDTYDKRFDIYQFGLTLYRMTIGDSYFYQQYENFLDENKLIDKPRFAQAIINHQFPRRESSEFGEHIPQKIVDIIQKCLNSDLDSRYDSATEIINDLSDLTLELLDWQYVEEEAQRSWEKVAETGIVVRLVINIDGSSQAMKINHENRETRIRKYCKDSISRSETKKFLRSY